MEEAEPLSPASAGGTPFSEAMNASFSGGSAPNLADHPHLDNSMRSLSSSVAARRRVSDWQITSVHLLACVQDFTHDQNNIKCPIQSEI